MDLFRAVVQLDERSQRALDLTTSVLAQNAANYTAWYYRALLIKDLGIDPNSELDFVASIAEDNAKNYQIWHHRRLMLERLGENANGVAELAFTTQVLEEDEDQKNYHAWAHRYYTTQTNNIRKCQYLIQLRIRNDNRQWVITTFKLWDGELAFVESLLLRDRRNNSAWNQRYFVLHNTHETFDNTLIEREIEYDSK